ncbi:uncharacterized protein OCT59_018280 [Rhizophagus irregularis]|uniref:uncharacterized protein n=1 Tax=Rhizophagus irregularis TaxID=588596 RepID=UPI0019D86BE3|nr:hypothetical protein OCT59_018280 [Rhizophagus irregularis]GET54799.1 hypothetical protein RIR_jg9581.t1 [Rhizophagus irregularis DAOM 181602=DAOM 197198]
MLQYSSSICIGVIGVEALIGMGALIGVEVLQFESSSGLVGEFSRFLVELLPTMGLLDVEDLRISSGTTNTNSPSVWGVEVKILS